ncbi:serine-aspartate repeat-containing protein F-like isoform X1 [Sycon ciliatum]|uniref:serine-aspartate repeat-containing protein F-like isoform X1 n=2 Tax=Sycon ciliatum TaxID=27933 RepID=UPI0020A90C8F|eukprot:scpid71382/ scgid13123/ Centrosomal protein of 19 kDa
MSSAAIMPIKCGYRHSPPRLILCYKQGGKTRQRTMPVRNSSQTDSTSQLVDQLLSRHADYLTTVPRQQIHNLVERLLDRKSTVQMPGKSEATTAKKAVASLPSRPINSSSSSDEDDDAARDRHQVASPVGSGSASPTWKVATPTINLSSSSSSSLEDFSRQKTRAPAGAGGINDDDDDDDDPLGLANITAARSGSLTTRKTEPSRKTEQPNVSAKQSSDSDDDSFAGLQPKQEQQDRLSAPVGKKPHVQFSTGQDQVFEISRDGSSSDGSLSDLGLSDVQTGTTSSGKAGGVSTETRPSGLTPSDKDSTKQATSANQAPPLTSTPRKGAGPLGSLPSLPGLSPLPSLANTDNASKKKTKKKAGKDKAKSGGGKKKSMDALLGLLDDDDDDIDEDALPTSPRGKSDPAPRDSDSDSLLGGLAKGGQHVQARSTESKGVPQHVQPSTRGTQDVRSPEPSASSASDLDSFGSPIQKRAARNLDPAPASSPAQPMSAQQRDLTGSAEDSPSEMSFGEPSKPNAANSTLPAAQTLSSGSSLSSLLSDNEAQDIDESDDVTPPSVHADEDLNKLDNETLAAKKRTMDKGFETNRVKPGDPGFQYDVEEDFGDPVADGDCGWDEDDEDDEW